MQSSQSHPLSLSYREFKSRDENLEGLELGKYTVMRELGKGSFGKVYEATNKSGGSFAVKLLDKKEAREEPNPRVKAIRERLIESQPRLMRQCHSPNLIKLLDVFENDDLKILIIEFCDGRTLADQLKQRSDRRFSEKEAVDIIRHIINGIAELHRHSIVHRDLKTDNVMQHEGIYKIIDFGFSKKLELSFESEQTKNTVLGTPTTMAPEVMAHQRYGLKADIWSIGIIFFQIVLGYSPYNSNSAKTFYTHIEGRFSSQIPDFTQNGVTLSPQAYDFLKSALKVDPDTRIGWREMVQHPLIKIRPEEPITGRFTERHNMTVPPVAEELAKGSLILTQIEIGVQEIQMKKQLQEAASKSKENLPRNEPAAKKQRQAAQRQDQSVKKQGYAQKQEQGARGAQKQAEKQAIRAVPKRTNRFDLEKMMEREEEAERLKKVNDRRESQRKLLQMEEFKPRQSGRKHSHQRDTSAHTQRHFVQANLTINEADQSQQLSTVLFKLQGEVQPKRNQALDSEYVGCLKLHLECLKTEFVLNQIFTPIQEKDLLDLNKRVSVEFMHLLISRCFKNLSPLKEKLRQNPQHVHRAFRNLYKQVEHLHCRVAEKFQQYDQKLLSIENKYMEIGKDLLLKVLQGGSEKEKNKIIGGVELREDKPASQFGDFTKAQQIAFTSLYIQKLLPSISYKGPCPTRLLQFLRFYGLIMNVTLESLGDESFSEFVRRITI